MEIKKISWFFPVFMLLFVVLSILVSSEIVLLKNEGVVVFSWIILVINELVVLLIACAYIWAMKVSPARHFSYGKIGGLDIILSLIAGYSLIPIILLINNISMLLFENHMNNTIMLLQEYPFAIQIILIAVIPSLVEEFVFRGLFYSAFRKQGVLFAALINGLIFGCFHLNINQFAYAVFLGAILSIVVEATGSVWASTLVHFAINTFSVTSIFIQKNIFHKEVVLQNAKTLRDFPVSEITAYIIYMAFAGIVFLLVAILCIVQMAKRHNRYDSFKKELSVKGLRNIKNADLAESIAPLFACIVACIVYMVYMEI